MQYHRGFSSLNIQWVFEIKKRKDHLENHLNTIELINNLKEEDILRSL